MTLEDLRLSAEERAAQGDLSGAAEIYEQAGLYFEAARAWRSAGDPAAALSDLTRVPADDPRYRESCLLAITLADQRDELTLAFDNALAHFIRGAPANDAEAEALDLLARLYERHGFPENAAEILVKLSGRHPDYGAAALRLSPHLASPAAALTELPPLPSRAPSGAGPARVQPVVVPGTDQGPVFRPGLVIAGRYRLEERIGTGGMSVVFRAQDLELEDEMAVKVLTQAVFDPAQDARLRRELMLSRQLVHPNIVRVFEMGLAHGLHYLVMELLRGSKLADRMRGAIGLDEGLGYLAQACAGLQAAHDLGIIHRDVKPGNFFLAAGGVLKVMDFGLAKVRDAPGLTGSSVIAGTPAYMAPEQASDFRAVSSATDIYALGVVAYEMFTARLPFVHDDPLAVLIMHREVSPQPPRSLSPSLPEELERVILRCLDKTPSRRFASCRELGQRLQELRAR